MKTAIVYKSIFGTSKQYAVWLHESTGADIYPARQLNEIVLQKYDAVVVCGGTYAGILAFNGFLKKYQYLLVSKKLVLIAVGMAKPDDKASIASYESIPEKIRRLAVYYKLPGKIGKDKNQLVKKENLKPVFECIAKLQSNRIILREVTPHEKSISANVSFRIMRTAA